MKKVDKILTLLTSLRVAVFLLIVIAIACALGTAIPQGEPNESYLTNYSEKRWLGILNGKSLIFLQFDHVYTSFWFLFLLAWLSIALISCSWRRQWPMLQSALRWVDYKNESQINKLTIAKAITSKNPDDLLKKLTAHLKHHGWEVKEKDRRIAARKGVSGRVGPLIVHLGLILLIMGATFGALYGQKTEKFLVPNKSIDLLNSKRETQLNLYLKDFQVIRDPKGRPEQFVSTIKLEDNSHNIQLKDISVNHPWRSNGITIYQADWELAAITVQIDQSPKIQFPLELLPQLGREIWGLVIPTKKDNSNPILLTMSNENGPINIFNKEGENLGNLMPDGEAKIINGASIRVLNILTSSGLLIKYDPGVPFVYFGFGVTLLGGLLSVISTKQIWVISKRDLSLLYIGGLSNRNLSGFANELPKILAVILNP